MYRRRFLAGVGLAGMAGCLDWSESATLVRQVDGGASSDPTRWNEMHVAIWTVGARRPDDPAVAGVIRGLEQLDRVLGDWFGGYAIRVLDTRAQLTCRDRQIGQLVEILEANGADPNRLHHVIHGCSQYLSASPCNSCRRTYGSAWGPSERYQVTTNSAYNRLYGRERYMVRSIHHLIHAFVTGETAREATGLGPEVSGYDAEHSLGSIRPNGHRTVMADRYAYRDEAAAGACSAAVAPWQSRWPAIDDLEFSTCTRQALERAASATRSDG